MVDNGKAPATKKDIQQFVKHIEGLIGDMEGRIGRRIVEENKETRRHFDVVYENMRHDLLKGALNDKVEQHEDRIQKLEEHTGLVAA